MAADYPRGFKPAYHLSGGLIRMNRYTIADSYATSIFYGDLVKATGTTKGIQLSTSGDSPVGVFAGCNYTAANGEFKWSRYWPASTDTIGTATAYVWDDPNIVFECQSDAAVAVTQIGELFDIVTTHSGSTITGQSGMELDVGASTNDDLVLMDIIERAGNAAGQSNVDVHVLLNLHAYQNGGAARVAAV